MSLSLGNSGRGGSSRKSLAHRGQGRKPLANCGPMKKYIETVSNISVAGKVNKALKCKLCQIVCVNVTYMKKHLLEKCAVLKVACFVS